MIAFSRLISRAGIRTPPARRTHLSLEELEPRALLAVHSVAPLTAVISLQGAATALARPAIASPLQSPGLSPGSAGFNATGTISTTAVPPGVGSQDPVNQAGLQAYFLQGQPAVVVSATGLVSPLANVSPLVVVSPLNLPFRYYQQSGSGVDTFLPPMQTAPLLPVVSTGTPGSALAPDGEKVPAAAATHATEETAAQPSVELPSRLPAIAAERFIPNQQQVPDAYFGGLIEMKPAEEDRGPLVSEKAGTSTQEAIAASALILAGASAATQPGLPDDFSSEPAGGSKP